MKCGTHEGSDTEGQAADDASSVMKRDATNSINLLTKQYEGLSGPDSMAMKSLEFEQDNNSRQFQQQSSQLNQNIGKSNLAGSGAQSRARENLSKAFQSKQEFTREKAVDERNTSLDKLTMEMRNIINSTRASLQGLASNMRKSRQYDKDDYGNLSNYGIDD